MLIFDLRRDKRHSTGVFKGIVVYSSLISLFITYRFFQNLFLLV